MSISLQSFGYTLAVGFPVVLFLYWITQEPRSRIARAMISAVIALMITPTVWAPFDIMYIEAASIVLFCGLIGLVSPGFTLAVGGLPILCATTLIYVGWNLWRRRGLAQRAG
jgi:hypothetical protein